MILNLLTVPQQQSAKTPTSAGLEVRKPGYNILQAFAHHFYSATGPLKPADEEDLQPVAFENAQKQCWCLKNRILVPLESDEEGLKPHRFIFEISTGLGSHGGGNTQAYETAGAGECRYTKPEDVERYRLGNDRYVNAYEWGMLVFPWTKNHAPVSQCREIYKRIDQRPDWNMLEELVLISDDLHEDLEGYYYYSPESIATSTSFIGRRGTVQDWADSVVWNDDVHDAQVSDAVRDTALLSMCRHLLQLRKPIQGAEATSHLVHLNLYKYAEWPKDPKNTPDWDRMPSIHGFFDPSTLFWRPSMYAKAMLFVDALLDGWVKEESDNLEFVKTLQKYPVNSQFLIRAFLFRLLSFSKEHAERDTEQDTGAADRLQSFVLRFNEGLEVVTPFL